jgi:hypothetical protein
LNCHFFEKKIQPQKMRWTIACFWFCMFGIFMGGIVMMFEGALSILRRNEMLDGTESGMCNFTGCVVHSVSSRGCNCKVDVTGVTFSSDVEIASDVTVHFPPPGEW